MGRDRTTSRNRHPEYDIDGAVSHIEQQQRENKRCRFTEVSEQFKVPVTSLKSRFTDAQHRKKPVGRPPIVLAHIEERIADEHSKLVAADKTPTDTQLKQRLQNGVKPLDISFNGDRGGLPDSNLINRYRQRNGPCSAESGGPAINQNSSPTGYSPAGGVLRGFFQVLLRSRQSARPTRRTAHILVGTMHANLAISFISIFLHLYVHSLTLAVLRHSQQRYNQLGSSDICLSSSKLKLPICAWDRTGLNLHTSSMAMKLACSPTVPICSRQLYSSSSSRQRPSRPARAR